MCKRIEIYEYIDEMKIQEVLTVACFAKPVTLCALLAA